ncbi:MAG: hypothetical protein PHT60_06090 [Acidiphilium sp.]|nr:hypothetical protein [Acidiphilium sp.]MDD4935334.1 hypothetical protein [Acidiphilium sp.]
MFPDRRSVGIRFAARCHPVLRRVLPSRLLPIVIFWLSVAVVLKSAGLIEAAFAQFPAQATSAAAATQSSDGISPASTNATSAPYRPVSNWTDRPPPPPMCKPNPLAETGESTILMELKHRQVALDERARALDREQQELDATKAALGEQVAALKPLAERLESLKAERQSSDDAKWAALVATYSAMEPRSAARIFDGLAPGIVFNVLRRMNNRKAAAILADMSPEKAQAITERFADESAPPMKMRPAKAFLPDGAS